MRKLENKVGLFAEILPSLAPMKCYIQLRGECFVTQVTAILRADGYDFEKVSENTFLVDL